MSAEPGLTGRQYANKAKAAFPDVTRKDVNRCLYSSALFHTPGSEIPAWHVTANRPRARPADVIQPPEPQHPRVGFAERGNSPFPAGYVADAETKRGLSRWQLEAYESWVANDRSGIVEAVTGAGKSRLALAAIKEILTVGGRALVVVPSKALLHQWASLIRTELPNQELGRLGAGHQVFAARITVAVVHTLVRNLARFADVALIVADEVHGYGAPVFATALLSSSFGRLGLTATLERTDDAVDQVLRPYFGKSVYTCNFSTARRDGRIAPARIALLGVPLAEDEREVHDEAVERKRMAKFELTNNYGIEPKDNFFASVSRLAASDEGPASEFARLYLAGRSAESNILANARGKRRLVRKFSNLFKGDHRGLIFCERIAAADEVADMLGQDGVRAKALTSRVPQPLRETYLSQLLTGEIDAVTCATALDQGIDIPDIDTAIIIGSNQQKRQMIQRLGRALRTKRDNRSARIVIAYAMDTWEDPMTNGHRREFVQIAKEAAENLRDFGAEWSPREVFQFLDPESESNARYALSDELPMHTALLA
ncbi:MAG: DEAD/DEAH box helicase [Blastocatellia bacterium]|nr:DEAD/DEAH box helicase [Blastocatellia bacterium]